MPSFKVDRVSEDIKRELADIFRSLKDPRIGGLLSIVGVDLSRDLSQCKVFVSSLDGKNAATEAVKGLNNAAGFIRREIAARVEMRKSPVFIFVADDSIEHSAHINKILFELGTKEKETETEQ